MENTATTAKQASTEFIQFLEDLQSKKLNLPSAIKIHWQEAVNACNNAEPDKARNFCQRMAEILSRLRGSSIDLGQVDTAQIQVSILTGAIYLDKEDGKAAIYYFEQGARRSRYRDYKKLESLSYFGAVLAYKHQEKKWTEALGVAQKALNTLERLPIPDRTNSTKKLQMRIEEEIAEVTQESLEADSSADSGIIATRKNKFGRLIPIVSNIIDADVPIAEDKIVSHLFLDEEYCDNADFGIVMGGNSMTGDGIFSGDLILISQQATVVNKDIAAVVITTPELEGLGVLRRYYVVKGDKGMSHWLLEASNPASEHLVVMPSGANFETIQNFYSQKAAKQSMSNPIKYYKDAELTIAGKFVGLVRDTQKRFNVIR